MNPLTHVVPKHSFITRRFGALVHRRLFSRRTLWIWPLLAIPILSALGYFVFTAVEKSIRDNAAAELIAIRDSDIEALRIWMSFQEATVKAAARDRRTLELAEQLMQLSAAAEPIAPQGLVSAAADTAR
ncbi:MAG TPA: hypothetical protein VL096_00235, partial [Pirellulaceae bacterium]|nr:hypothetical protein [Pirellulaceae bacterium]